MIQVIYDNSYSRIKGMSSEQYAELRKLLSYTPDENAQFFGGFKGSGRRYLIDKKGFFPTGLTHLALDLIFQKNWPFEFVNDRKAPKPYVMFNMDLKGRTPYKDQLQAAKRAYQATRGIISAPTGTGKSVIIALVINMLKVKTLVIVPNLSIKIQLTQFLEETFGKTKNIRVENIDSTELENLTDFDALIIDEAHHAAASTYHKLNKTVWKNTYYRVFMTATPFRNVTAEQILMTAITGSVIHETTYQTAVECGYIVPVEGFYIDVPKTKTEGTTYAKVYSDLVVNNEVRNGIIADILTNLNANNSPTLCLVREVKHGRILSELTGYPFVCGEDAESKDFIRQFNEGEITTLIGTYGVLGEGVDTRPAENIVIAGLGKAKSSFMQQCGRGVRRFKDKKSASIILFRDKSHKFTVRHYNEQAKIMLEEYGVKPEKLEV